MVRLSQPVRDRLCVGVDLHRDTMTVATLDPVTSATAIAEVGDFKRFTDRKQITRYAGLNPRTFDSADKQRGGRISKAGPRQLRWVLQQAAWCARRDHPVFRKRFGQLSRRVGKSKAGVAIARKLLLCMWAVVRDGRPYRPIGAPAPAPGSEERCR